MELMGEILVDMLTIIGFHTIARRKIRISPMGGRSIPMAIAQVIL